MNLLIVDDSSADTRLMQLWLRASPKILHIEVITEGGQALQYARGEGDFTGRPVPQLILLDVNLPDMYGLDVLAELRREPALAASGIMVLSGTYSEMDARRARELGALEYLVKPFDADDFAALVQKVEDYFDREVLPGQTPPA